MNSLVIKRIGIKVDVSRKIGYNNLYTNTGVTMKLQELKNLITLELINEYANTTDKLVLCSEILETSIDHPDVERLDMLLYKKCEEWNQEIEKLMFS
jgi:hypothetical protein